MPDADRLDTTRLGSLAAEVMELLEELERQEDEPVSLGTVAIVAELNTEGTDDDPGWTNVIYRCSDSRRWIQYGLFEAAQRGVDVEDDDD